MKLRFVKAVLLSCTLFVVSFAAAAQSGETQKIDLGDGFAISIPADWNVTVVEDTFTMVGGGVNLTVMTPPQLAAQGITFNAGTTVDEALERLLAEFDSLDPHAPQTIVSSSDGRPLASRSNRQNASTDEVVYVVDLGDGAFGYLSFTVPKSQSALVRLYANSIIRSFDESGETAAAGLSIIPCTVSANTADTAQLRVGPGTNRGAISFLPANTSVTATGRIELDDGSVWYQLNKDQAAPNGTAASELWVWENHVTLNGGCDQLGEAVPPPIIPINAAPPAGSTPAPEISPVGGLWSVNPNNSLNVSCRGLPSFYILTSEILDEPFESMQVTVLDSNTFTIGTGSIARVAGNNRFSGIIEAEGMRGEIQITLTSATTLTGQMVFYVVAEGTSCSASLGFSANLR